MKNAYNSLIPSLSLALLLGASTIAIAQDQSSQDEPSGEAGYMATQTHPANPDMWDPTRVEESLRSLGYSEITDLREEDGTWIFTAQSELSFDPATGEIAVVDVPPAGSYRATQMSPASPQTWDPAIVEDTLIDLGYSDIGEIRGDATPWELTARKDGQDVDLTLDPQTGEVRDEANQVIVVLTVPAGGYMATQMQPAAPDMWDPAAVEENLQELGYSDIGEVRQEDGRWMLQANREGQPVMIIIDPRSGEIFAQERIGSLDQTAAADGETNAEQ